jgi:hypothetical protein
VKSGPRLHSAIGQRNGVRLLTTALAKYCSGMILPA